MIACVARWHALPPAQLLLCGRHHLVRLESERDDAGSVDGAAAQQQCVDHFNEGLPGVGVQVDESPLPQNVSRLKKLVSSEAAHGAGVVIGVQHSGTEQRLVEPGLGQAGDIGPLDWS